MMFVERTYVLVPGQAAAMTALVSACSSRMEKASYGCPSADLTLRFDNFVTFDKNIIITTSNNNLRSTGNNQAEKSVFFLFRQNIKTHQ